MLLTSSRCMVTTPPTQDLWLGLPLRSLADHVAAAESHKVGTASEGLEEQ